MRSFRTIDGLTHTHTHAHAHTERQGDLTRLKETGRLKRGDSLEAIVVELVVAGEGQQGAETRSQ